jgi:hypothetical protein
LLEPNAGQILAAMAKHADEIMRREFGLPLAAVIIDTAGKAAGARKTGDLNDDANAKVIRDDKARTQSAVAVDLGNPTAETDCVAGHIGFEL